MIITKTYPLQSISVEEAIKLQFRIVDCMAREFQGHELLSRGDLGVVTGLNQPLTTRKAEKVIAEVFGAETCMLVRGAGSGSIRLGLHGMLQAGDTILVHKAPIYDTTDTSLKMLGIHTVQADFNEIEEIQQVMREHPELAGVLVQHTRQIPGPKIGIQFGADLSCFSSFKLLGPEGIGILLGKKEYIEPLRKENYSGGMQTQGHEALDVLRGLVYAPVALAIEAEESEKCVKRLRSGEIPEVKEAFIANAQSKVILVELKENIAQRVLVEAEKLGAAPYPIGCESRYEMVPLFYRISGTFRKADPTLEQRMIRINPLRAGSDTVIRILKEAIERGKACL